MAFSTPAEVCMERTINIHEKTEHIDSRNIEELYDIKWTVDWIKTNNYQRVCLQLPDSLLGDSVEVCKKLKSLLNNEDVFIMADTTYNSCCVDEVAARHIEADAIIHYGHSCLSPADFPVLYVYPKASMDIDAAVNAMKGVNSLNLVLFYDVSLEHLRESLCQKFFQAFPHLQMGVLPKVKGTKSLVFGRSIVNKDGEEKDPNVFKQTDLVFIGTEGPTLFNLAVCSEAKELHLIESSTCVLSTYSQSQWFKRRRFLVEKCKDAATIGVLVCTLSVSNYLAIIQRAKRLVRARGKKAYTLTVGKPNVAKLANLSEIQLFVLVACPENELYSSKDFLSPIIYPYELELALNQHRDQFDTNYSTDFNELLPEGRNHRSIEQNGIHPPDVSLISGNLRDMDIDNSSFDKKNLKDMQLDALRKEDWAVSELGIGKAINDRSWKGLEQHLGNTSVELAAVGRKGIASGYEGELF